MIDQPDTHPQAPRVDQRNPGRIEHVVIVGGGTASGLTAGDSTEPSPVEANP